MKDQCFVDKVTIRYLPLQKSDLSFLEAFLISIFGWFHQNPILIQWLREIFKFVCRYGCMDRCFRSNTELVAMVMADTERRNFDNSNDVQCLLLDSASTIHIVTSKRGMTNLQPCNKAVDAALIKEDPT
jgi:hypothetical protein